MSVASVSIAVESVRSFKTTMDLVRDSSGRDVWEKRIHYAVTLACVFVTGFLLIRYMEQDKDDKQTRSVGAQSKRKKITQP